MALSLTQTIALQKIVKRKAWPMRVASLGYPDIIAHIDDLPGLTYRADSEAICKRHGLVQRPIPDAHSFFELLGCKLDVFDIVQERGCEILCDLNSPLDPALKAYNYDIVLDVGTAEHCINIWQAMVSMAGMVKQGGYIIHENPFNWGNHGFYNLNPTLFADFYESNGFKVLECKLVNRNGDYCEVPHTKRFKFVGKEMNVFALAQRVAMKPFTFPVQSKYAGLIPVAGVRAETEKEVAHAGN